MSCPRCDGLDPERASELDPIGGSHDPFDDPGGELRRCPACGQHFRYTYDHDNALGYEPLPKSLDPIGEAAALELAELALVVAKRHLAYFSARDDSWSRHVTEGCEREIARLTATIETLRG